MAAHIPNITRLILLYWLDKVNVNDPIKDISIMQNVKIRDVGTN